MTLNAGRVRLARELRGYTQAELARRAEISQGQISKVENALSAESDSQIIDAISTALAFPTSFLLDDTAPLPLTDTLHFRRNASATKGARAKLTAETNVRWEHLKAMLHSMDVPDPDVPAIDEGESKDSGLLGVDEGPEAAASRVRAHWRLPDGPITHLTNVVERHGIIVFLFPFPTDRISGLSFWAPLQDDADFMGAVAQPVICLNSTQPGCRLRFSLAHELGHLVMHRRCAPSSHREEEANRFASELLMPAGEIRAYLPPNLKIAHLAAQKRYWLVSMAALLKRASDLECISERKARYLWMQLGQQGYRTHEPIDIALEMPNIVNSMIAAHMGELAYSEREMATLLKLRVDDFRAMYNSAFVSKGLRLVPGR